ncbi:hypothetical protein Bbelb_074130 [Branchiostoma belcheri]|nr:hypothetical protein Bbelb_074130 [Branchiostoma belcheri]
MTCGLTTSRKNYTSLPSPRRNPPSRSEGSMANLGMSPGRRNTFMKKFRFVLGGQTDLYGHEGFAREVAAVKLLKNMLYEGHPLHDLVPPARTTATGRTLRNGTALTVPAARSKRLKNSFLHKAKCL